MCVCACPFQFAYECEYGNGCNYITGCDQLLSIIMKNGPSRFFLLFMTAGLCTNIAVIILVASLPSRH